ncbi:MAG: DUF2510 domain-containing protein, partial [Mycobacteriaceae bacterium]|nr:DUF2510 domain-containing protein [Mycobacteriaceae bacterium]
MSGGPRYALLDQRSFSQKGKGLQMTASHQPGWYDDPEDPNSQRYWDGQA